MRNKNLLKKSKKRCAGYDSDIPVTLKQVQGHQNQYELEDPKQGYVSCKV